MTGNTKLISSRDPELLHPDLREIHALFIKRAAEKGIDVLTTCTYRNNAEQDRLYALGRTVPSHIGVSIARPLGWTVTKAKGGQSAHNYTLPNDVPAALAFDVVPVVGGKPYWKETHPAWAELGAIGTALGLTWYGAKDSPFLELPHFQHPLWRMVKTGAIGAV